MGRGIVLNTAVGGLRFMGYITKGSKASLTAGSVFGGLLMLSALIISKSAKTNSSKGNILGAFVSAFLGKVMGKKFLASKKFMPSGLLASFSLIAFVYNLIETKNLYTSSSNDAAGAADEKETISSSTITENDE